MYCQSNREESGLHRPKKSDVVLLKVAQAQPCEFCELFECRCDPCSNKSRVKDSRVGGEEVWRRARFVLNENAMVLRFTPCITSRCAHREVGLTVCHEKHQESPCKKNFFCDCVKPVMVMWCSWNSQCSG